MWAALEALCVQDDALLVVCEHVAGGEALQEAVVIAAVALTDLAVHLHKTCCVSYAVAAAARFVAKGQACLCQVLGLPRNQACEMQNGQECMLLTKWDPKVLWHCTSNMHSCCSLN